MKTVVLSHDEIYKGSLILINREHPYREELSNTVLESVHPGESDVLLEKNTVKLFTQVMNEIDGWKGISAVSGYRSYQEQQDIYVESLADSGIDFTQKFVAFPGHSEHQTGFAIDLGLKKDEIDFICPDFPYEGVCQRFRNRSVSYGFIERYQKEKEHLTNIACEPWHFRYVGSPHANIMYKENICLEEYIEFLKQFSYGQRTYHYHSGDCHVEISYIVADREETCFQIEEHIPYIISGNNIDGYIITAWR